MAHPKIKAVPARVTTREVSEKNVRKVRINIMLDEDIIEYFKQRAALPISRVRFKG